MLTVIRKTSSIVGNLQILCGNIIPQTSKQELCVVLTVMDYISEKYNKYATKEDALETDLLQDPVLWDVLFPCCGPDQFGNLMVQGHKYKKMLLKIRVSRAQLCTGENKKDIFYFKI